MQNDVHINITHNIYSYHLFILLRNSIFLHHKRTCLVVHRIFNIRKNSCNTDGGTNTGECVLPPPIFFNGKG